MNESVGVGEENRKVFKRREIISVKQWTLENTSHNSAALKYIVIKGKRMLKVNSSVSQKCGHVFTHTICLGHFTIPTQIITILLKRSCLWLVQSGLVSHSPHQANKKKNASTFSLWEVAVAIFFSLYISVDSSWILERLSRINVSWMLRHWKKIEFSVTGNVVQNCYRGPLEGETGAVSAGLGFSLFMWNGHWHILPGLFLWGSYGRQGGE